jgi:hypothetical protein
MKFRHMLLALITIAIAAAQAPSRAVMTNLDSAQWVHEKSSDSVVLLEDPAM